MKSIYITEMSGTLYLFENNKIESQKHPLYYNSDAKNVDTDRQVSYHQIKRRKCIIGPVPLILCGLICLIMGFLSAKYTITDIILTERIKMRPWFITYGLWLNPDPELRINVYIFTVENANEFLRGTDSKLKLKEIGPIVYREYLQHQDVVHHDNSTLSYTSVRWTEFLPYANKPGILNETITVPNFAVLAAASYINEYNYLIQIGYNFLDRRHNVGLFINITVYDYLWNYRSKLLEKVKEIAPTMVPVLNAGALHTIYDGPERYNVKIGTKYGDSRFFHMNTINGAPTVPGYNVKRGDCFASVENSTEGAIYGHRISKESTVKFWRKALCRAVDLHFDKEMQMYGILGHRYILGPDVYDRKSENEIDCYKGTYSVLPNGLTDASKCYFDMPMAESQPHFYGRSDGLIKKFEGLNASAENHLSFSILEPTLGFPMKQAARSQMNLIIPKLSSFFGKDYQLFSDMILPLFWVEILQIGLSSRLVSLVGFVANVLPIIEVILPCALCLVGFALILTALVKLFRSHKEHLAKNRQINFSFVQRKSETGETSN